MTSECMAADTLRLILDLTVTPVGSAKSFWSEKRVAALFGTAEDAFNLPLRFGGRRGPKRKKTNLVKFTSAVSKSKDHSTVDAGTEPEGGSELSLSLMGSSFRLMLTIPIAHLPEADKSRAVRQLHAAAMTFRRLFGAEAAWKAPSQLRILATIPSGLPMIIPYRPPAALYRLSHPPRQRPGFDDPCLVRYLCRTAHGADRVARLSSGLPPWVGVDEVNGLVATVWATTCDLDIVREVFTLQRRWTFDAIGDATLHGDFNEHGDERYPGSKSASPTDEITLYWAHAKVGFKAVVPDAPGRLEPDQLARLLGWLDRGQTDSGLALETLILIVPTREDAIADYPQLEDRSVDVMYPDPNRPAQLMNPDPPLEFAGPDWVPDGHLVGWIPDGDGWARIPGIPTPTGDLERG
jgi:hypothetical protein